MSTTTDPVHQDLEIATPRILGLDPGLNITGYGLIDSANGPRCVEGGVVRSTRGASLEVRLKELFDGIVDVIESLQPAHVAIEQLYSHYERPTTAVLMGHARGVLCLCAAQSKLPVFHYRSTQVKSTLAGNGRAPKTQIQMAVARQLNLPGIPEPHDVADALAVAMCHYFWLQTPAELRRAPHDS